MQYKSAKKQWDTNDNVKYCVSSFEEEDFKKYYENGGKEQLSKRIIWLHTDKPTRKKKWNHLGWYE